MWILRRPSRARLGAPRWAARPLPALRARLRRPAGRRLHVHGRCRRTPLERAGRSRRGTGDRRSRGRGCGAPAPSRRERIERLRRHAPAAGTLLDVGAATGALLEAAGESFADVEGVEPDPITSEQARAAGHRVRTGTLEDVVAPNGGFDAITMVHTLEHLDSPRRALERARELLAPGGAILIETPTTDCLWFRVAPGRWRQLIPGPLLLLLARDADRAARWRRARADRTRQGWASE